MTKTTCEVKGCDRPATRPRATDIGGVVLCEQCATQWDIPGSVMDVTSREGRDAQRAFPKRGFRIRDAGRRKLVGFSAIIAGVAVIAGCQASSDTELNAAYNDMRVCRDQLREDWDRLAEAVADAVTTGMEEALMNVTEDDASAALIGLAMSGVREDELVAAGEEAARTAGIEVAGPLQDYGMKLAAAEWAWVILGEELKARGLVSELEWTCPDVESLIEKGRRVQTESVP